MKIFIEQEILIEEITNSILDYHSFWFWFCLLEFIIILILLKKLGNSRPKNINNEKLKKFRNSQVNMDDLMMSINDSKKLYKELSRTYHPDRFVNNDKQLIAEQLFKEVTKHKRDYKVLSELKKEIEIKLT